MLKCSKGHSLAKATCHRKVREVVCDICEEELCQGDDFFQCKGCEYDVCAGCFKSRSAAKVAVSGKFGVLDGKFKQKADKDKKDRDKKAAHTEPTMDADDTRVFAFTGFPPEADPVEAVTLIKEYAHDFLGEFAVVVLGACNVDAKEELTEKIEEKIQSTEDSTPKPDTPEIKANTADLDLKKDTNSGMSDLKKPQ